MKPRSRFSSNRSLLYIYIYYVTVADKCGETALNCRGQHDLAKRPGGPHVFSPLHRRYTEPRSPHRFTCVVSAFVLAELNSPMPIHIALQIPKMHHAIQLHEIDNGAHAVLRKYRFYASERALIRRVPRQIRAQGRTPVVPALRIQFHACKTGVVEDVAAAVGWVEGIGCGLEGEC